MLFRSPVYKTCTLNVGVKVSQSGIQYKKIRKGPIGNDLQLYDTCALIISTVDCSNSDPIGKLWVEYEIEMLSTIIEDQEPRASNITILQSAETGTTIDVTGVRSVPWVTDITHPNTLTVDYSDVAEEIIVPPGAYLITTSINFQNDTAEAWEFATRLVIDSKATSYDGGRLSFATCKADVDYTITAVDYVSFSDDTGIRVQALSVPTSGSTSVGYLSRIIIQAVG